jgi:predicted HTH transcriptional regulator
LPLYCVPLRAKRSSTREISSPETFLKTIIGFANTAGGTIVIGVENGSKRVRGVPGVLSAEERVTNLIADNIRPRIAFIRTDGRKIVDPVFQSFGIE